MIKISALGKLLIDNKKIKQVYTITPEEEKVLKFGDIIQCTYGAGAQVTVFVGNTYFRYRYGRSSRPYKNLIVLGVSVPTTTNLTRTWAADYQQTNVYVVAHSSKNIKILKDYLVSHPNPTWGQAMFDDLKDKLKITIPVSTYLIREKYAGNNNFPNCFT